MALKILLVDNNHLFLGVVRKLLERLPEVLVVGEAYDGLDALHKAKELAPDLVLLDIAMPKVTGLDVALRMQSWLEKPAILFVTMHDDVLYEDAARDHGALGVVGKTDIVADLLPWVQKLVAQKQATAGLDGGSVSETTKEDKHV
jgi:DNA-binding NarL/FixJ family response regulator